MVEFGSGRSYLHAMDRDYGHSLPIDNSTNDVGVGIKDIGFSLGLGPVPNIQSLGAKMRTGHKKMELTFMGMGKGSAQAHSPEMYGLKQRTALKELQKVNRYDFTTHSSVGITGLAGMDQRGNFSKQSKENSLNEIKRAVHFAADVMQGGPVVVHSGEFFRNMADATWNVEDERFKEKFKLYEGEQDTAAHYVVDRRSGEALHPVRINERIPRAIWNVAEKEYFENRVKKTVKPGETVYIDYDGNKVSSEKKMPKYDEQSGEFKTTQMGWKELKTEAEELTKEAKNEFNRYKHFTLNELERNENFQSSKWRDRIRDIKQKNGNENDPLLEIKPEEAYIITQLDTQVASHRGWGYHYSDNFQKTQMQIEETKKRLKQAEEELRKMPGMTPEKIKMEMEAGNNMLENLKRGLTQYSQGASSSFAQADKRGFSRFILSGAAEIEVDGAGRVLIPEHQREFAKLSKNVIFAGVSDRVEVWDAEAWKQYKSAIESKADSMAETLGQIGAL